MSHPTVGVTVFMPEGPWPIELLMSCEELPASGAI